MENGGKLRGGKRSAGPSRNERRSERLGNKRYQILNVHRKRPQERLRQSSNFRLIGLTHTVSRNCSPSVIPTSCFAGDLPGLVNSIRILSFHRRIVEVSRKVSNRKSARARFPKILLRRVN